MSRCPCRPALISLFAVVAVLTVGPGQSNRASAADAQPAIRALLVIGGCCHDYAKQKEILTQGISARAT